MSNIATKEQLDKAMYELAKVTAGIQKAEAVFQEKLDDITAKREQATSPFQILKERLEAEITTYVNKNRGTLFTEGVKTLKTPYGTISFKITKEKVVFDSEEVVIANLKRNWFKFFFNKNYRAAIKTEYSVVKEVLKNMPEEELTKLGVKKTSEERLHIVPDLKTINS